MLLLLAVASTAQFTEWSAPVNLGPPVNTQYVETCVHIAKNGLSLYFASNRQTGNPASPDWDLYVSQRASVEALWGEPRPLTMLNLVGSAQSCPALSLDEHRLYFQNAGPGGCGGWDLWVSRRHDRRDDFGWQPPVNLGCQLNSSAGDYGPVLFEDEQGRVVMYFASTRAGTEDIYMSVMGEDGIFGAPIPVPGLNTPYNDRSPAVRRDGLEVILESNRLGGLGGYDVWAATRASTADPWSTPVNLGVLNSPASDGGKMSMSFDGRQIYFRSNRPGFGTFDLYVATREKLRQ